MMRAEAANAISWCMKDRLNATTEQSIGAAIKVHKALGPGLLESINFNVKWLVNEGLKRFVNGFPE